MLSTPGFPDAGQNEGNWGGAVFHKENQARMDQNGPQFTEITVSEEVHLPTALLPWC